MQKIIFIYLFVVCFTPLYGMEVEQDFITLLNPQGEKIAILAKDLLPFEGMKQHINIFTTHLQPNFIPLLKALLYANQTAECIERPYLKCAQDVSKIIKAKGSNLTDFVSWFELMYFMHVFNISVAIQDAIAAHMARLMKNHELEAAQATNTITDQNVIFSMMETWQKVAFYYKTLFGQELSVEGIKEREKGYSIKELFMLGVVQNRCRFNQPKNDLVFHLSNMNISSFDDNDITLLDKLASKLLRGYPHSLTEHTTLSLLLANNNLSTLPIFYFDLSLGTLDFRNNKLTTVPSAFPGFGPEVLLLGNNNLGLLSTDEESDDNLQGALSIILDYTDLRILDLSNNKLTLLPDDFLSKNPLLEKVWLNNNQLTTLPNEFLINCPNIAFIQLNNNYLTALPSTFLSQAYSLYELHLGNNQLIILPDHFLESCVNLMSVNFSGNNLKMLPQPFLPNSNQLKFLDITNKDGTLPAGILTPITQQAINNAQKRKQEYLEKKRQAEKEAKGQSETKIEEKPTEGKK